MKAVPLLVTALLLLLSTRGFLAAAASSQSTDAGDGNKYVHLDRKGDLVISYPANLDQPTSTDPGPLVKYKYIMPTHIAPLNRVSIQPGDDGGLFYEYDLENGSRASQAICDFNLYLPAPRFVSELRDPVSWIHVVFDRLSPEDPRLRGYVEPRGYALIWHAMSPVPEEQPVACTTALKPGAKAVFKVLSPAKPGFVRSYYLGPYAEDGTQDMPNDVAVELDTFLHFPSSGKSQLILGPAFAPDTPRNVLANELLKSLESLVEQHQIDSHSRFARKAAGVLIQVAGTTSSTLSPQADGALETLKSSEPNGESEKEVWLAIESDLSNSTVVAQIHSPRSVPTADAMSHLIQRVDPKAPAIGNLAKFGGTVKVHIVISTSGEVASVAAVSGASLFVRAATEAVKQWKFSPFLDGKTPTMVATDIDFDFPAGTSESENAAGKEPK